MGDEKISIEKIEADILRWTAENVSENFEFRPNQFESIRGIIDSIVNYGLENNILQAPTGTGKSFICIISAGVLADCYGIKSYILASDLYLWQQYADAIVKFKLKRFGFMKGSIGNYRCDMTAGDYEYGECKQKRVSLAAFRHPSEKIRTQWPCSVTCKYMLDRFKAERTPVTLLTYQLWLYQMNLVKNTEPGMGFTPRDVVFCDECHNIPDIVSRFAQPKISARYDKNKIIDIADYGIRHNIDMPHTPSYMTEKYRKITGPMSNNEFSARHISCHTALDIQKITAAFEYVISCLNYALSGKPVRSRANVKVEILREYVKLLGCINEIAETALGDESMTPSGDLQDVNEMDRTTGAGAKMARQARANDLKTLSWIHNYISSFVEYLTAVTKAGEEYVVVERTEDDDQMATFTFYCAKEDYLCQEYLLKHAKHKVMTSATVGNINSYMSNIGIDVQKAYTTLGLAAFTTLPNIFDFTNSLIYYLPDYKMSYREKDTSFPEIQKFIYKICEMYPDMHGMINTGSYTNSRTIYTHAPKSVKNRLCIYDSSKNKDEQIRRFKASPNKILIGPTLVEGVDLPGDLCRFIIIAKLPYPNISSPMTKAKMSLFPLWYRSTTSNTMIQNIGRGVRFQGDWCHTFILDGCFGNLYDQTLNQYAPEIQNRFRRVTTEMLNEWHTQITQSSKSKKKNN